MAEAVLIGLTTAILESLGAEIAKPVGSAASQKIQLLCGAEDELQRLGGTVQSIQAVLWDAEKKQWHDKHVKLWLKNLKDVLYDVDDLFNDVATENLRRKVASGNKIWKEVRLFFSKSNQLAHRVKVANEIQKLRKTLDEIADNRRNFNLEEHGREEPMAIGRVKKPEVYKPDDQIIGRNKEKEEIKQLLFNSNSSQSVSGVAIVGIGGLGKTALAQLVFGDGEVKKHFGLKMWACVTDVFDVELVIKGILESAKEDCPEHRVEWAQSLRDIENTQDRALYTRKLHALLRKIVDGKKYLLVLDDVWIEFREKWSELGDWLKYGLPGSKILVTTRNREVAKVIDKDSAPYYLKGLSSDASWDLFREAAFGNRQAPVGWSLEEMGRVIVGKCAGVPLAIRTVGSFLYGKDEAEWPRYKVLDLPDMLQDDEAPNVIMEYLQFSYDHLTSWLKQCFAYCSLFPKDYVYHKDVIVRLWMAQGFIASRDVEEQGCIGSRGVKDYPEERAEKYLTTLVNRSFLNVETVGDGGEVLTFKMHDLMHDLAQKVTGTECRIVDLNKGGIGEGIRHASIISHVFSQDELVSFLEKSKLRTFLHLGGDGLKEESSVFDCHEVFSGFRRCRVLGFLGKTDTPLSPSSFGELKHLRFLDVSKNPSIDILPESITDLLNLETLVVSNCKNLSSLPRDLGKLINLRFLDVSRNRSIENLPESIADLRNLETLKLFDCSSLTALPGDLGKLVNLRHLLIDGCRSLTYMPCGLNHLTSLQTLSRFVVQKMDHRVPGGVGRVDELGGLNKLAGSITLEKLGFLQPAPNKGHLREKELLRSLELRWWVPLEERDEKSESDELIVWENLRPHQNLTFLGIFRYMGRNPPSWLSSISYMVKLVLSSCERWKYLPPLSELPSLRELRLSYLYELEFVQEIRDPQQSNTTRPFFPSLETLHLWRCGKLNGWWGGRLRVGEEQDHMRYDSQSSFPKLSHLQIWGCNNLKSLPLLPSVIDLYLRECSIKWLEQQVVAVPDYSSKAALVSTSIPLSKLKKLYFDSTFDFDHWVLETLLPFLRNLEFMSFRRCSSLWSLSSCMQYLSSLQHLSIEFCQELDLSSHDDEHGTQWRSLANLRTLEIKSLPKLVTLPEGIQHVTTLQSLSIHSCKNLRSLPKWIDNFSKILKINDCPGIECSP